MQFSNSTMFYCYKPVFKSIGDSVDESYLVTTMPINGPFTLMIRLLVVQCVMW